MWREHKEEIQKQLTIIVVREVEAGLEGKEKKDFIRGLLTLPNLWKECMAQELRNVKVAEAKKGKELRLINRK